MKFFDTEATRAALAFDRLIPALANMFAQGCNVPLRHNHAIEASDGTRNTVLIMPAWNTGGYLGIKTVNIFPGNAARSLPGLFSTYILYSALTGEPLAYIDGNEITSRRTAAASALAAWRIGPNRTRRQLVVGAGRVGNLVPEAYLAVLPIEEFTVWDIHAPNAHAMVERLRQQGLHAKVAPDLERAVVDADIVTCATLSTQPLIDAAWLQPGSHLDLIGSFTPQMREAHANCFGGDVRIFIDTEEALMKSGDLLVPMAEGVFQAADVAGDLVSLVADSAKTDRGQQTRTVFKAVGTALEDLASAILVVEGN